LAEPIFVWGEKLSEIEPFINGLNRYPKFEHVSDLLLDSDDAQREQARALVFAALKLDERFVESVVGVSEDYSDEEGAWDIESDDELMEQYITRQSLVRLIMDHPDKVDRIVEKLGQDPDIDLDRLRLMVNHGQQSLADGVL
jgi:transcription termination factor NusB